MKINPPSRSGNPLTGRYAVVLASGGRLKDCDCSAPLVWSYDDAGSVKACQKGESCSHTAGALLYRMARSGWTEQDARSYVFDRSCVAFTWTRCQDDPENSFVHGWAQAVELAAYYAALPQSQNEPYPAPLPQSAKKPMKRWRWRWSAWQQLLGFIERNPGLGRNEIVAGMPWREGITKKYLKEAIERGYVTFTVGSRNKRSHEVIAWPVKPHRKPKRAVVQEEGLTVDTATGEVLDARAGVRLDVGLERLLDPYYVDPETVAVLEEIAASIDLSDV